MIRAFLRRELAILLRGITRTSTAHLVSAWGDLPLADVRSRHIIEPESQLTSATSLADHLQTETACQADTVILLGALNGTDDVHTALSGVADAWSPDTRLINVSYFRLWRPFIRLLRGTRQRQEVWIPTDEIENLLEQAGFEIIERRSGVVFPLPIPFLARFINRWLTPLPFFRWLGVYSVIVARPRRPRRPPTPSVSVIVAARNEAGNIDALVQRLPELAEQQELIFVEGGSSDDTWGAIQRVMAQQTRPGLQISAHRQTGKGKGDAVRLGFEKATGDILIILDADLSVPPEELPRFIDLMKSGLCEFANGSRLVYPMEQKAMQFLNLLGNRLFGLAFTFLLGQPVRDTLCGTKALWADDYRRIAAGRSHFGEFDPFGDFDLLFGAARLHLKIRDVPVHYKERVYGSTNISRFRHGILLLRMTMVAARRLKFV